LAAMLPRRATRSPRAKDAQARKRGHIALQRRGPAHRRQYRQAAGTPAPWVMTAVADLRCGIRPDGFPFLQPDQRLSGRGFFLSVEMRACRRKALLTRPGFNEAAGDWTLRPRAGDPGLARTPAGVSLSSQVCAAPLALRGLQSRVSDSAMIDKPEPTASRRPSKKVSRRHVENFR
jgi:hypothetical protein